MKIFLKTNSHEKCGVGDYGRNLLRELIRYYDIVPEDDAEVVIVNWNKLRVPITSDNVAFWHSKGKKVVLINHDTHPSRMEHNSSYAIFGEDLTIVHEMGYGIWKYIPMGIVAVDGLEKNIQPKIGIAGFPFPWKRFDVAVNTAKNLGVKLLMVAPSHEFHDPSKDVGTWKNTLGNDLEVITDWLPFDEVVRLLSGCAMNIFWFKSINSDDECGQSASALMGVSAQRPMIVSRHRKLEQLAGYEEEFYVANSENDVTHLARQIFDSPYPRIPKRILEDRNWGAIGLKFKSVIDGLVK